MQMSDEVSDIERFRKEIDYYKRQLDELTGENVKLDYTLSGLRHQIKQRHQGFALLSELQQSIGVHRHLSSIFGTVIRAINSTLGMDKTIVLTPADRENYYRPSQWLGFRTESAESLSTLSLEFPPAFARGTGLLVVNKSSEKTPLIVKIQAAFDLPYFVCLPVMGDNVPIGLLLSGRLVEAKPFYPPLDQGDVDTFQAIAGLVSAAVQNRRVAVLEEMDRLKTEFFANISHEFRTPITLTLGPLKGILADRYGEVSDTIRDQVLVMRRNQERLLGLINQILDLAKLEAGRMQLAAAPIPDMNRFVEERAGQFRSIALERGIELRISLDPRVRGADLFVDREKLDRLLLNLLSNAFKFTKQGYVEVSTEVYEDTFRLAVNDTGIGIKADQIPYIFDRFRQADGSASREYAGTGIGLAWVKEIAALHCGDVTVYSQYGKGSSFRVSIPLGKAHLDPASVVEFVEEDLPTLAGSQVYIVSEGVTDQKGVDDLNKDVEASFDQSKSTILYAEDNCDMRSYVRDLLVGPYNVFLAVDGRDGIEKARRYRPDLILADHMMPHMSGRDLLREVRDDLELRSTPVIFVTARAGTEARVESLAAGADDYLAKPFDEQELLVRIRNLLRARAQERELAEINRRLEAKVEEQMAELVRSGELKRFLPQAVAEDLLKGDLGAGQDCERCKITVLFIDIVGFTSFTDRIEPEELSLFLNEFLREMTAVAVAHGGTVVQLTGDALMVIFGAPRASRDVAQAWSSIQTAISMRARTQDLAVHWRRRGVLQKLDVRIGINTGYCTVGVFGSDFLQAYTAYGTPVNIAARLQPEAAPGEILCSFSTYALVQERIRAEARGPLSLRGIAYPVEAYVILGPVD
jgi:signal transduction histidine kinase/class 3 adenylate cyclase